ncbi:cytochrome c oxidase subunit 3 [Flavihumibacter petaseus]|uniref:Cytochrome c oxidase subunit III n=1 Tax=Flavihumibacter petaseus NBRC 106054 TaxID=1220578 RepID=A0A0E9MX67_9BACT|nr:heme-copper oxidase subunit III [Flavihumibacter petaseus]GAO42184.1 cytochrome c oxidase subunit III [Flavihumibacter petaseus NBRC 106054]
METQIVMEQRKRIHPAKFTLWVGIGSIVMMFAGLTSAYIVKRSQPSWVSLNEIPRIFWYSTLVILASSVTMQMALRSFKQRERPQYRRLILITGLLGALFIMMQWFGFKAIWASGTTFAGAGAGQFLYIIAGLHALHVLAGIIALIIMSFRAFSTKRRNYNPVPVEVMSTYWHFVDILWLYLLVFFMMLT